MSLASSSGGRIPRGVSRLSFRNKKKLSLFGKRSSSRVDSKTDLMADEDVGKSGALWVIYGVALWKFHG